MNAYFYYFYNFMRHIFEALYDVVISIGNAIVAIFDVPFYMDLFNSYKSELSPLGWIAAILTHILVYILFGLLVYLIFRGIRVLLKFKVRVVDYEKMRDEVVRLKREIMKANYEKDKILAMKISDMGVEVDNRLLEMGAAPETEEEGKQPEEAAETENITEETPEEENVEVVETTELRFPKLSSVDRYFHSGNYVAPVYDNNITLEELCTNFRNFAASRLGLYYDMEVIRQTFATFGAAKLLILQGISGTGKTSLPYALGQFIENPSLICSVQPSWRDRTELFGYYNDFTKKYTETDFLKALYEAHYYEDMRIVILDEMNIARVEYYFAEDEGRKNLDSAERILCWNHQ